MKTYIVLVLFACCGMAGPIAWAGSIEPATPEQAGPAAPEELIVTATRRAMPMERLPASVTVISRTDIEALQAASLPQLLGGVAGVDVAISGGYGKATGVRLRGADSGHVLVLLDGVRMGSATLGTTAFEHIPVSQIERIEIVRGPHSSVWGSEALGGVIHIFTRKGTGATPRYAYDVGGGSYNTTSMNAGVSGAWQQLNYSAAAAWFDSHGIDARVPTTGQYGFDQPDKDGYDNLSFHARGGYDFGAAGELDMFVLHAEGDTEFDGSVQDKSAFVQQVIGARLLLRPLHNRLDYDDWTMQLRISQSRDKQDSFAPSGAFASRFNTRRGQLSWQNDVQLLAGHDIGLGLDYRRDEVDSSTTYTESRRDNLGVYGRYSGSYRGHQLIAAVRWDDDQRFGSKRTGSIGWSYLAGGWLRLYASYGTAYKTPTFNELFFPGFGNPALRPETANSLEAGLAGRYGRMRWAVSAYRTRFDDLILTVYDATFKTYSPQNVGTAKVSGIEAELALDWKGWQAQLAVEYLAPEDTTTGKRLPRRATQHLSLDLQRDLGPLSVAGRVLAAGGRFDDAANAIRLGGFVTLDVMAEYRLNKQFSLSAKVANLLDTDYQTAHTYNSFGRNFFISLSYRSR